jgi:integrase
MSVFKFKNGRSPYWHFDFQVQSHRFHGSTKCTTRREAEAIERQEREKARALVAQLVVAKTSLRMDDVAERYWQEVGQHHAGADTTEHRLALLIRYFGKDKIITEITDNDIARLVAWRRGHRSRVRNLGHGFNELQGDIAEIAAAGHSRTELQRPNAGGGVLISPHTVNHTTEQLRKLFTRAKLWGVHFDREPKWVRQLLPVPAERVRELSDDEADRLEAAIREDLFPFFAFARASGLRLKECFLRWSEVQWDSRQIVKIGKGGRRITASITPTIREILWPLQGHHPDFVFTFIAQRTRDGRVKGQRCPLTYGFVQTYWQHLRKKSSVVGFRFHDYRHDLGTKLLRETGNLKLVQRALNHHDIKSTLRYAHVLDSEVADALERVAKSRSKSRRHLREVG